MNRMRPKSLLSQGASLLVCGILAGLIVAAAAFPLVALSGLAAKAGADSFDKLPSDLLIVPPPQASEIYAADGKTLITEFADEYRKVVKLNDIAEVMRKAIVASEDQRFYEHHGVDLRGVLRAVVANSQSGEVEQGASTLTMQYVRNALFYAAGNDPEKALAAYEQTAGRKLREMRYAVALEKKLSKDQILENYLNIAYFGHRSYGIYGASLVYFGKAPKDLALEEAALLAGLVQAPSAYDPTKKENEAAATERRNWVLDQMAETGYPRDKVEEAKKKKIALNQRVPQNNCANIQNAFNNWGFFCDYVLRWWKEESGDIFGKTVEEREKRLMQGGYKITTSLNPGIQAAAFASTVNNLGIGSKLALGSAFVEPGTGYVRAMAVNRTYSNNPAGNGPNSDAAKRARGEPGTYPNTANPLLSGGADTYGYHAGSTFKIFTIAAALEAGYGLQTARYVGKNKPVTTFPDDSTSTCRNSRNQPVWCPENDGNQTWGQLDMYQGLGASVNSYFAQLIQSVGADKVIEMAQRLGLRFRGQNDPNDGEIDDIERAGNPDLARAWGSFTIGTANAMPLDMATVMATLANDGTYCKPLPVQKLLNADGTEAMVPGKNEPLVKPDCKQVVDPGVARATIDAARCPVTDRPQLGSCQGTGTAGQFQSVIRSGRPVAGKTGTSDNNRSYWMIATTPELAGAAFEADPDTHRGVANRSVHTKNVIIAGLNAMPDSPKTFGRPPDSMRTGNGVQIPEVRCKSVDEARSILQRAGFKVEVGSEEDSPCPKGAVSSTAPSEWAPKGATVTLMIASGRGGPTDPPPGGDPRLCQRPNPPPWCPRPGGPGDDGNGLLESLPDWLGGRDVDAYGRPYRRET